MLDSDKSHILRLERYGSPNEANTFLVEKMLESGNAGLFSEFVAALQHAGKYFMFNTRTHTHRAADSRALLMIHDKAAYFPY